MLTGQAIGLHETEPFDIQLSIQEAIAKSFQPTDVTIQQVIIEFESAIAGSLDMPLNLIENILDLPLAISFPIEFFGTK